MDSLEQLRARIDEVDGKLLELLNERMGIVIEVGKLKEKEKDSDLVVFRPEREATLVRRILANNQGPLTNDQLKYLIREVVSLSITFQQPLKIAFLGPVGTYTHSAALEQFGKSAELLPQSSIQDVFRAVDTETANYGVVPVENSTEGAVNQTHDLFFRYDLRVCAEIDIPIHHALMASKGGEAESLKKIYSHEQSIAQCRNWLQTNFPNTDIETVSSNGEAARLASIEEGTAAIAGESAAKQFDLEILHKRIEDQESNTTRFFVLGRQHVPSSGEDRTSLLLFAPNRAGALVDLLSPFQTHNISLSRVVSRPAPIGQWSYAFFIDFDGHVDDENVAKALAEVRQVAYEVKVLGSYPRANMT